MSQLIILVIIVAFEIFLGIIVFIKNPHNRANYFFAIMTWCMSIWSVSLYLFYQPNPSALFWGRLVFAITYFTGYALLGFSIDFPSSKSITSSVYKLLTRFRQFYFIIVFILSILSIFSGLILNRIEFYGWGTNFIPGPIYFTFIVHMILCTLASFTLLGIKFKRSRGIEKIQIKYLFVGLLISGIITLFTNLIWPLISGNNQLSRFGPYSMVFLIGFTTYAIARYRLMAIKLVITRSIIFFFLTLAVAATFILVSSLTAIFFAGTLGANQYVVWFIAAILIVLFLQPLKDLLAKATDKVFFKRKIDYAMVLKDLTQELSEELDIREIIVNTQNSLVDDLKLKDAALLLYVGSSYFLSPDELENSRAMGGKRKKRKNFYPNLVNFLKKEQEIIIVDELERIISDAGDKADKKLSAVYEEVGKMDAALIAPIFRNKELSSILLLGPKQSGDVYNNDDIKMLEMLAPQLSSALFKASLYQEAQLFNVKLQKEIEKATGDLKVAYEKLEHANEHLQNLDKAKSEFMSITSHQLRTPLTGIMGYLSMVLEGDYGKMKPNQAEILKEVFEASQRLIRMVNLFLNITRIEAGRFNFFWQDTDMYELIKDQVHELLPNAKKKGLVLELLPAPKDLKPVIVDRDKVKDVILNLIDNAIKYTEKGSIKVKLAKKDVKNFEVIIKDTGIGIDPKEAEKLFEKFTRGDGMARINPNGAGLGLFIAKKMVEGHHGKVWVESEGAGKGSEFHVVLPIKQV